MLGLRKFLASPNTYFVHQISSGNWSKVMLVLAMITLAMITLAGPGFVNQSRAAGPLFWDWPAGRSFSEMELDGAAINTDGQLVAGLLAQSVGPQGPDVFWRAIRDDSDGFYTGCGHSGEIYQTSKNGESELVVTLDATEIFSLKLLDDGSLLAGCGPEGQLYQINRDHEATLLGTVDGGYVWSMENDATRDVVWLATGSPAAVYRYSADDGMVEVCSLPAQNVLDIVLDDQGRLLIATQGPGLIYRLDPDQDNQTSLLFETPQDEARQFIHGPEGKIFALALNSSESETMAEDASNGSATPTLPPSLMALMGASAESPVPQAGLYLISDTGLVIPWWSGEQELMICSWNEAWGWIGGGTAAGQDNRSELFQLTPPSGYHQIAGWEGGDIIDIFASDLKDKSPWGCGGILVCQANPGLVSFLSVEGNSSRIATSPPLDGGHPVQWGKLSWNARTGAGKLKWSVRSGNRSTVDSSWSQWSSTWSDKEHRVDLPVSRYLQWRVEFPDDGNTFGDSWQIHQVAVSAWQENLAPVIRNFTIEQLRNINLGGLLAQNSNVTQTFRSGLRAEFNRVSTIDRSADTKRAASSRPIRVFSWAGYDPNEDRLIYQLEYRRETTDGDSAWRTIVKDYFDQIGSWDTTLVPDGTYEVRVTASDAPDNPGDLAKKTTRRLGSIYVDNAAPELEKFKLYRTQAGWGVSFRTSDSAGVIAGAAIQLPDGSVRRLDPVDKICDSSREKFLMELAWPPVSTIMTEYPWRVRVEVWDLSGNIVSHEGEINE